MSAKTILLSAVGAFCLFLPQGTEAGVQKPPQSVASSPVFQLKAPWAVQPITQGKDFSSCRVSAAFDNNTVMQFTHSSARGLENVSVAFGGNLLTAHETYPVTVSAPGKKAQTVNGVATSASTIMLPLGGGDANRNALWKSAIVAMDINDSTYRFSLAGLDQTAEKLSDCLHPNTALQTVEAKEDSFTPLPPETLKKEQVTSKNKAPTPAFEVINTPYTGALQPEPEVSASIADSLDDHQTVTISEPEQDVKLPSSPSLTTVVGGGAKMQNILNQAPASGEAAPIVTSASAPPLPPQDFDALTQMYQESERQNRELGRQLQTARTQCAAEKKQIEDKLFDPQISSEEQRLHLYDLEKKVEELQKALSQKSEQHL